MQPKTIMLYLAIRHSHIGLSLLAVLSTFCWILSTWHTPAAPYRLSGIRQITYLANRITTGLAAITGIVLTLLGPWHVLLFPYIGFAGFVIHEVLAPFSRRAWLNNAVSRRLLSGLMGLCMLGICWLMSAKII